MKTQNCMCTSGKLFAQCCQPLLERTKLAKTPQQLMRSRFSAFALGGYGSYLIDTWLPSSAVGLDVVELSQRSLNWLRLEIVSKSQKGDQGIVEFKAFFLDQQGDERLHHEISLFRRHSGQWLYVSGDIVN